MRRILRVALIASVVSLGLGAVAEAHTDWGLGGTIVGWSFKGSDRVNNYYSVSFRYRNDRAKKVHEWCQIRSDAAHGSALVSDLTAWVRPRSSLTKTYSVGSSRSYGNPDDWLVAHCHVI